MQVLASDADDPTYGSSARLVYSVLDGEHHFTVDPKTGEGRGRGGGAGLGRTGEGHGGPGLEGGGRSARSLLTRHALRVGQDREASSLFQDCREGGAARQKKGRAEKQKRMGWRVACNTSRETKCRMPPPWAP